MLRKPTGLDRGELVGRPAPLFAADAYVPGEEESRNVALADLRGSWVVLVFYVRDFGVVCPAELNAFARRAADFEAEQAVVLAISTDSVLSHRAWFESHPLLWDVPYTVLADTSHRIASAYGVLAEDGSARRATFVVDPDGVLRDAVVADEPRDPRDTLRVLRELRASDARTILLNRRA